MTITIKLRTDNAAFEDKHTEIQRILTAFADDWRAINLDGGAKLRDYNGNVVGEVKITGK